MLDEPVVAPKTYRTRRHAVVTESFTSCDLGNSLMLKLCGFIEDQQAEILDVNEKRLQLRVGRSWLARFWHGSVSHGAIDRARTNVFVIPESLLQGAGDSARSARGAP